MAKKKGAVELWALDTEDDSKGKVELLNFYNGEEHFTFEDPSEALEWLLTENRRMQIWCVNLQYDLVNLFREKLGCLRISFVGSRVISASIKNSRLKFCDTLNHWKISVAEMGKRIGLEKLEGDLFNQRQKVTKEKLKIRCRRDTEITYHFVKKMGLHYESIGARLKATIGSTALDYFYTHFSKRPENPFPRNQLEFCLKGYYGGRTEIFFNKPVSGNIFYFDFNSLYPAAMRNVFPTLNSGRFLKSPSRANFSLEGMADVTVCCPSMPIPYLPHRTQTGKLVFPVGKFRGVYTYFEIRKAVELGYTVEKIHKALEFDQLCRPFDEFVTKTYDARLIAQGNKDQLLSDSFKLILNNLYGKFGQKNEYQKLLPYSERRNGDQTYGGMVLRTERGDYPKHSNGIWSAYVTAYARHSVFEALDQIRKSGALLIYCDTDSAIFENDKPIFKDGRNLGEMKLEGIFRYAHFKLPKLYALVEKRTGKKLFRAKGVPRKKARKFFEQGKATFRRPYKIKETLRRNLSPKRKVPLVMNYWALTKKELGIKYDKRIVLKTGHTKPLTVGPTAA